MNAISHRDCKWVGFKFATPVWKMSQKELWPETELYVLLGWKWLWSIHVLGPVISLQQHLYLEHYTVVHCLCTTCRSTPSVTTYIAGLSSVSVKWLEIWCWAFPHLMFRDQHNCSYASRALKYLCVRKRVDSGSRPSWPCLPLIYRNAIFITVYNSRLWLSDKANATMRMCTIYS